ncbi:hypothetical protein A1O1_05745 [Capronia coronata CBS 617.96]|uniref:Uncharacterized protein n=1 Tax=Capronia coronata CBS 617.96 TaxID=1182541 RepID=W9Y837_9EURO|nr:uncharacterized protein A1O1_05745 [Capronia coronata CBS 617.96]EXJ85381.1 hypothetical protein A1O1_05745 [Capronia coronata CBS 617.96]
MSNNAASLDDDDYVARLLAEDARKSSLRYAAQGTYALTGQRPANAAPKPNTRFLKTLVREADNHNAALKKKEELEARIRLRRLRDADGSSVSAGDTARRTTPRRQHHREREDGTENARASDDGQHEHQKRTRTRHTRYEEERSHRRSRSPERGSGVHEQSRRRPKTRHSHDYSSEDDRHSRRISHRHRHKSSNRLSSRSRSRSRQPQKENEQASLPDPKRKSRHHHSHEDFAVEPAQANDNIDKEPPRYRKSRRRNRRSRSASSDKSSASSDPLSSLIGPDPLNDTTTIRRGRGFNRGPQPHRSNIDVHFSAAYDPTLDVDEKEDDSSPPGGRGRSRDPGDDWEDALEALRDRRAWRTKQADRMREAGFDEDEIERWKSASSRQTMRDGDGDPDIQHVKWRRKGEPREWDAGKLQDEDAVDSLVQVANESSEPDKVQPRQKGSASSSVPPTTTTSRRGSVGRSIEKAWRGPENGLLKQFRSALG